MESQKTIMMWVNDPKLDYRKLWTTLSFWEYLKIILQFKDF